MHIRRETGHLWEVVRCAKWVAAVKPASAERPHIYILLCMFNGFAFARPLCGAIKMPLTGFEF